MKISPKDLNTLETLNPKVTKMPSIKVTDEEYEMIQRARRELAIQGLQSLPKNIVEKDLSDLEKFTLGAIVGIGAILLLKELGKK